METKTDLITPFLTAGERQQLFALYRRLLRLSGDALQPGDCHKLRQTLQRTVESGLVGRDLFGLNPIIDDIRKMEKEEFSSVVFEEYDEQFMYFFGLALIFFSLTALVGERKTKRRLF